jgi:hypothetical protein
MSGVPQTRPTNQNAKPVPRPFLGLPPLGDWAGLSQRSPGSRPRGRAAILPPVDRRSTTGRRFSLPPVGRRPSPHTSACAVADCSGSVGIRRTCLMPLRPGASESLPFRPQPLPDCAHDQGRRVVWMHVRRSAGGQQVRVFAPQAALVPDDFASPNCIQ